MARVEEETEDFSTTILTSSRVRTETSDFGETVIASIDDVMVTGAVSARTSRGALLTIAVVTGKPIEKATRRIEARPASLVFLFMV